jgi:hypothetical protein
MPRSDGHHPSMKDVTLIAIRQHITRIQAADILGISAQNVRRIKRRFEKQTLGWPPRSAGAAPRRWRIGLKTLGAWRHMRRSSRKPHQTTRPTSGLPAR